MTDILIGFSYSLIVNFQDNYVAEAYDKNFCNNI